MQTIFEAEAKTLQGKPFDFDQLKGKYVLIINTASKCGLTPQLDGLEKIHQEYKDKGLILIGFPCNQFGNQEPGDEKSIQEGCVINYGVNFQMMEKIEVNGPNAHPLYKFLKSEAKGCFGNKVKWNFTKFLVDPTGKPVKRFGSFTKPEKIDIYLKKLGL